MNECISHLSKMKIKIKIKIKSQLKVDKLVDVLSKYINKTITLKWVIEGENESGIIEDKNICGTIIENIVGSYLCKNFANIKKGLPQQPPDFIVDTDKFIEIKAYNKSPNFDISNYNSFINQICEPNGIKNKIINTTFIVFNYECVDHGFRILSIKSLKLWNIVGYDGCRPISLQVKNNVWYNIRPKTNLSDIDQRRDFKYFIDKLLLTIDMCPSYTSDQRIKFIENIKS